MIPSEDKSPEGRFDEALRAFAARAPRRTPADAAEKIAWQIRQNDGRRRTSWMLTAAAAFLLVVVGATLFRQEPQHTRPEPPPLIAGTQPLGQGEVLLWIDGETPLYMTFQPPDGNAAEGENQ